MSWIIEAWKSDKQKAIVNYFMKCGFTDQVLELCDGGDEAYNELCDLISEICHNSTVDSYLAHDDDAITSVEAIDTTSKTWQ